MTFILAALAALPVTAVSPAERFFDGSVLYTMERRVGGILYFAGMAHGDDVREITLVPRDGDPGVYALTPSRQAEEPPMGMRWGGLVRYCEESGGFFAFYNSAGIHVIATLARTAESTLDGCLARQEALLVRQPDVAWLATAPLNAESVTHLYTADISAAISAIEAKNPDKRTGVERVNLDLLRDELAARETAMDDASPAERAAQEEVARRVEEIYRHVSRFYGGDNTAADPDELFCSRAWNETYKAVLAIDDTKDDMEQMYFYDDLHWTLGVETPLEARYINVHIDSPTTAQASFTLADDMGTEMPVVVALVKEDGVWKINTWLSVSDPSYDMLREMRDYVRANRR